MNTNSKFDTRVQIDSDIAKALDKLAESVVSGIVGDRRTCLSCEHFNEKNELCSLAGARPPARVIVFGCPSFEFIPF